MTHVVTRACCNDAACAAVCPVNCIHPTPGEPEYGSAELLFIDPATCIDCGACVEVCPVDAIVADTDLKPSDHAFLDLNAQFFSDFVYPRMGFVEPPPMDATTAVRSRLRLAVVGTGPAAVYAVEAALDATAGELDIDVFERLPAPWGLVRFGVAPDHQDTKQITRAMERILSSPQVTVHLNVEIGEHLSHEELLGSHHAVIYATGAPDGQKLVIPGEALPGSAAASQFIAWYNGHPDAADLDFDLSGPRAVIVGNGNVALDVARILVTDPDELALGSDIADRALARLRDSRVQEVVVMGRRGPEQAAYTTPELLALLEVADADIVVDPTGLQEYIPTDGHPVPKARKVIELLDRKPVDGRKRVVLRFLSSPSAILGYDKVVGIRITHNVLRTDARGCQFATATEDTEELPCDLVLRAVGYHGRPVAGLPFDAAHGVFHHAGGRVMDAHGRHLPGVYAAGWAKRGPSGVIGTNRSCAQETVAMLLQDFMAGRIPEPSSGTEDLQALLRSRRPEAFNLDGWRALDAHERAEGLRANRPRVKVVRTREMTQIALRAR